MNEITSRTNASFKRWLSLLEGRGIKKEGLAILSGAKLIRERQAHVLEFILPPKTEGLATDVRQTRLNSELFRELDVIGTRQPLAVVRAEPPPEWNLSAPRGLELIVALSDPGNLGAALRSASALGASRVILSEESASPFLPRALRAAAGATWTIPLVSTGPLSQIKLGELPAFALDLEGENLQTFTWPENAYLILGQEGRGVPPGLPVKRLKIPMRAGTESLNALAAASIALYSFSLSRR